MKINSRKISFIIKRCFDIVISSMGLVLCVPLFTVIAIKIKFNSKGPVIYRQERVGRNGKIFILYKFRTMFEDAEKEIPIWPKDLDSRITRMGNILRVRNLDELPQLFNVLKGDMSIVGPRPERPYFVRKFSNEIPQYQERFKTKPGITGWAQVNGFFGDTSIEKRLAYDLYYIKNFSLLFDIIILRKTFFVHNRK